MTNPPAATRNTTAFYAQAVISFGLALGGTCLACIYLPVDAWVRAFLALSIVFLVSSTFTLAKCVRDAQEDGTVISRLDQARLERLLAEFDPYSTPKPVGGHPHPASQPVPPPPPFAVGQ